MPQYKSIAADVIISIRVYPYTGIITRYRGIGDYGSDFTKPNKVKLSSCGIPK